MASFVSRYARAFVEVVSERSLDANKIMGELDSMQEILDSSPELHTVLLNPSVAQEQKLRLLDAITQRAGISKEIRNLMAVLVDNRRIGGFHEIVKQIKAELNERLGIAEAEIASARELDAEEKRLLEAQVAKLTGKTVRARYSRDAKLMGGAMVRVGSTIYDGSVRGQLQRLKEQLASS